MEADLSRFHGGLKLSDMYAGVHTPRHIAVLVLHLPDGSATWQRYGGPRALSPEEQAARLIEYANRMVEWSKAGSKGNPPQPLPDPPLYTDQQDRQDKVASQAERWLRRHDERMAAREQRRREQED